jgi:hypothetical protein
MHNPIRVERRLDRAHQTEADRHGVRRQGLALFRADTMFR